MSFEEHEDAVGEETTLLQNSVQTINFDLTNGRLRKLFLLDPQAKDEGSTELRQRAAHLADADGPVPQGRAVAKRMFEVFARAEVR